MRDISLTMISVDRSPGPNYLAQSVENLRRSGFRQHVDSRLAAAHLVVGECSSFGMEYADLFTVHAAAARLAGNLNAARALKIGARDGTPWVLFCEDDIDVCSDFVPSVGRWLDRHAISPARIFSFGAAYDQISARVRRGFDYWDYPVDSFYGTCCFAIRNADAQSLAEYWSAPPASFAHAYDLMVQGWMAKTYPRIQNHLASAPCFVQHIGEQSTISLERKKLIQYGSWLGREWRYAE